MLFSRLLQPSLIRSSSSHRVPMETENLLFMPRKVTPSNTQKEAAKRDRKISFRLKSAHFTVRIVHFYNVVYTSLHVERKYRCRAGLCRLTRFYYRLYSISSVLVT